MIAKHNKPTSVLLPWLKELTELDTVLDMYTTVLIFNKDEEFRPNIEYDMRQELDLAVPLHVQQLPNVGRETETFLRYIVHRYTSLPTHVLFVQDEAHEADELLSLVQNTFKPETEYLALNTFRGRMTADGDAYHPFEHHIVPYLWAVSTQTPFPHDGYLAAYHSQFLASKNRILHRPLSAYKFLLNALHQPDTDPMLQLPSAQMAGYVIERLWNALFDCWDVEDLHCLKGYLSSSMLPQPWIVNHDEVAVAFATNDITQASSNH